MGLNVETKRLFKFGKKELPDPDPNMTIKEVIKFYSAQYPEIASASIPVPKIEDETFIYELNSKIESKG